MRRQRDAGETCLVQGPLQVRGAHALGYVAVGRVRQEELPLGGESHADVLPSVNVLLTTVHHPDVTWSRRKE